MVYESALEVKRVQNSPPLNVQMSFNQEAFLEVERKVFAEDYFQYSFMLSMTLIKTHKKD